MQVSRWMLSCCVVAALHGSMAAQGLGGPRNDLPQPYRTTRDWGALPPRMTKWPAVSAVEVARDGTVYVVERCATSG